MTTHSEVKHRDERSIIIIRTNRWTRGIEDWARFLVNQTNYHVVIAADESQRVIPVPADISKVTLNPQVVKDLDLLYYENIFWTCGDYFLVAVQEQYPAARSYWLLDDDARINFADINSFFNKCEVLKRDFIGSSFGPRGPDWYWYDLIEWYCKEVYGCFFPMSYYSNKAAKLVGEMRRHLADVFSEKNIASDLWPNDESFVATTMMQHGLDCDDFNNIHPKCQHYEKFHLYGLPLTETEFSQIPPDESLYHPVLSLEHYTTKVLSLLKRVSESAASVAHLDQLYRRIRNNFVLEGQSDKLGHLLERQYQELIARRAEPLEIIDALSEVPGTRLSFIEVGARGGATAAALACGGRLNLVLFEPEQAEASRLREASDGSKRYRVVDMALAHINGEMPFFQTSNEYCSSLLSPNLDFISRYSIAPLFAINRKSSTLCARYDTLLTAQNLPIPDIIKVNVQGFEYQVLQGFGALLQDCLALEVATYIYPIYEGQKLLHDVIAFLSDFGFVARKIFNSRSPSMNGDKHFDGDMVEMTVVFTKSADWARGRTTLDRARLNFACGLLGVAPNR